jgi:hypothetical protein
MGAHQPQAEKLGYLGLGLMGLPMSRRLLNAGHDVAVWNRSAAKAALLVEAGARLANSPRDVAATASIIFMCVTDAHAVEDVVFGKEGFAAAPGGGKLVIDFSSIHPNAARAIAARLKTANGMAWIDAPVSGGTKGAEEGTLAVMAGGDADSNDIEGSGHDHRRRAGYVEPRADGLARRAIVQDGQIGAGCGSGCARDLQAVRFERRMRRNFRNGRIDLRSSLPALKSQKTSGNVPCTVLPA